MQGLELDSRYIESSLDFLGWKGHLVGIHVHVHVYTCVARPRHLWWVVLCMYVYVARGEPDGLTAAALLPHARLHA